MPGSASAAKAERWTADLLAWAGVAGSALSLFARLDGVAELSALARGLVAAWGEITHALFGTLALWIGLGDAMARETAILLSFAISILATATGLRIRSAAMNEGAPRGGLRLKSAWWLAPLVTLAVALAFVSLWIVSRNVSANTPYWPPLGAKGNLAVSLLVIAFAASAPLALFARDRASALAFTAVFSPVPVILAQLPLLMRQSLHLPVSDTAALASGLAMAMTAALVPISLYLAPAGALARRFAFALLGVAALLAVDRLLSL